MGVASPGDVNGDAKPDLLVGTFTRPPALKPGGRALLYFGATPFDTIPDMTFEAGDYMAGLGDGPADLNGDSWPDIVIGGGGLSDDGEVRVFYGGPGLDAEPDLVIRYPYQNYAAFGRSVEYRLDVNGDGYQDLVVGYPQFDRTIDMPPESTYLGAVYIYFGGPAIDDIPDIVLRGPIGIRDAFCFFGEYVRSVGDFDGDGYADLGVYQRNCGYGTPGLVSIYHCGPSFSASPIAILPTSYYVFGGRSAAFAPFETGVPGVQSVVTMGTDSTGAQGVIWRFEGIDGGGTRWPPDVIYDAARSLSGPLWADADLSGDGRKDLVIGGYRVLAYSTPRLDLPPEFEAGSIGATRFGWWVTGLDANGDAVPDLVVAEPGPESYPVWGTGHIYIYDLSQPLAARAFVLGEHRTIPLTNTPATVTIQLEPVDSSYSNANVDLSSVELRSENTGSIGAIPADFTKSTIEGDSDQNGILELGARFKNADLTQLFSSVRGRRDLPVALEGRLQSGRKFSAPFTLTVLGTGKPDPLTAAVTPNPMNPNAVLTVTLNARGPVTATLFDVSGRVVRTLLSATNLPSGVSRISLDGLDDQGRRLPSGIYFYRVQTAAGAATGRVVVAK